MNLARVVSVGILAIGLASCQHFEAERETTQPNILLIIADDLGFTDLSSYGSEIRTPNIDALAARGLRFSQFHTAPQCAPTRAMLYSGNNNHVAGALPDHREAFLSDQITPFPKRLQMLGYRTLIVGKWHLGHDAHQAPNHAGFDQSFVLTHGATHQFSTLGLTPRGTRYREDGRVVDYPTGEYTTTLFTNRIIDWIGSAKQPNKPFLAVASYTAPHWPLQVPEADLDLYQGVYDAGYDVLRQQRLDGAIAAGVAQPQTLPTRDPSVAAWDSLSPMQQRIESRKMELLAAMIEVLDRNIGRLIVHIRTADQLDNNLIILLSENGA
ncbi:MAG: sulfatase-like hydrolase/transferase, partial [Pseudomonadota bacterium]